MSEISFKETETLSNTSAITSSSTPTPNELKKTVKIQELPSMMHHITPAGISRERSFVRASNPQSHQVSSELLIKASSSKENITSFFQTFRTLINVEALAFNSIKHNR
jgi:hypothetical protein